MAVAVNIRTVDPHVSDLFFNRDLSECRDGENDEWKMEALYEEARIFAETIECLTGLRYHQTEIVADFFNRM